MILPFQKQSGTGGKPYPQTHQEILSNATKTFTYSIRLYIEYNYWGGTIFGSKGSSTYSTTDSTVTEEWEAVAYSAY